MASVDNVKPGATSIARPRGTGDPAAEGRICDRQGGTITTALGATLTAWNAFYSAVAGITATLVGLLFVALALKPAMMTAAGPTGLRVWAGQTFHSFFVVLVVSLVALIPEDSAMGLIITLGIVGVQGLVRVVVDVRQSRLDPDPHWSSPRSLLRFGLPIAAYLLCLWIAQALARGDVDALDWLLAVVFSLLFSASSNCWEVLKDVGNQDVG